MRRLVDRSGPPRSRKHQENAVFPRGPLVEVDGEDLAAILAAFPPTMQRPQFEISRAWSNASLDDPDRIIALVLARPSVVDLVRTIQAYGPVRVLNTLARLRDAEELDHRYLPYTSHLLAVTMKGVADAARQLTAR